MSDSTDRTSQGATRRKSRGALFEYFADIGRAIATTFEGLTVTSSWFFRRPLTIQYPDKIEKPVQETLPEGYRGILEVDLQRCTACALCQKTCPIGAVQVKAEKNAETGVREIVRFDIDMGRCMYCGLCSEACKFEALSHTTDFEGVEASPDGLILHFVRKPVPVAKAKAADQPPRRPLGSILAEIVNPCFGRVRWRGRRIAGTCEDTSSQSSVLSSQPGQVPAADSKPQADTSSQSSVVSSQTGQAVAAGVKPQTEGGEPAPDRTENRELKTEDSSPPPKEET